MEAGRMNGGNGEESYANNSLLQRKAITMAKPIIEEAIKDVYRKLFPKTLCIADMGCSSGPNTFYAISLILKAVDTLRRNLGRDESPEFMVYLNDLPSNDFNTMFTYMPSFQEDVGFSNGSCFITGVPGSFYERLFPSHSLHFVHSSYSLQWLSHVPINVEDNKGNLCVSTTSPRNVVNAYLKQFRKDFSTFLRWRAIELVAEGCMVLTLPCERDENSGGQKSLDIFEPLSKTINDMMNEGLIEEEKLHSFNVPNFFPPVSEVKSLVEKEGSFIIIEIGLADVQWNVNDDDLSTPDLLEIAGLNFAKTMRGIRTIVC